MAALVTVERVWPSHEISYVNGCIIVWNIAWHSHDVAVGSLVMLGLCEILHVNQYVVAL